LGLYIHIPFCAVRCGYCDFNTYTASELTGVSQSTYPDQASWEISFAAQVLAESDLPQRELATVFFGGGTPTLLGPQPLLTLLRRARDSFGLKPEAEVTVEANPDSIGESDLLDLAQGGVTRVSLGVQSHDKSVLATLDRTHNPAAVPQVVSWAQQAGLQVSLDLIYGTPGETIESWKHTLDWALSLEPDHISAYALIVEQGTALASRIRRGDIQPPDDDLHADMYEVADVVLSKAGFSWYEVSNWAKSPACQSRHNQSYWKSDDWWGVGPGAHSHVGGVRWWNVKHPSAYAERVHQSVSPAHARESLTPEAQLLESLMLGIRMREGLRVEAIPGDHTSLLAEWVSRGLIEGRELLDGRICPTVEGRLKADYLARELSSSVG
jgi:oxygen-independent coproporphyrinogen-3 oxidase